MIRRVLSPLLLGAVILISFLLLGCTVEESSTTPPLVGEEKAAPHPKAGPREFSVEDEIIALEQAEAEKEAGGEASESITGEVITVQQRPPSVEFTDCFETKENITVTYKYDPGNGVIVTKTRTFRDACLGDTLKDYYCNDDDFPSASGQYLKCGGGCEDDEPACKLDIDFDGNGVVNNDDINSLVLAIQAGACPKCDLNGDGTVDMDDVKDFTFHLLGLSPSTAETPLMKREGGGGAPPPGAYSPPPRWVPKNLDCALLADKFTWMGREINGKRFVIATFVNMNDAPMCCDVLTGEPVMPGDVGRSTMNYKFFATKETAELLADCLGGTIGYTKTSGGPFSWPEMWYVEIGGSRINAGLLAYDLKRFHDQPARAYSVAGADVDAMNLPNVQLILWDAPHQSEKRASVAPGTTIQVMANAWNAEECNMEIEKSDVNCSDLQFPEGCGKKTGDENQWIEYIRLSKANAGCTYTFTYTVTSSSGAPATDSITVTVTDVSGE